MHGEVNWAYFDELVRCYASMTAHSHRMADLERDVVRACESSRASRPGMHDFSFLMPRTPRHRDDVVRRVAWAAQHIYKSRAWSVGQKLLARRGKQWYSPLARQIGRLGYEPSPVNITKILQAWPADVTWQDRIDAMLVEPVLDTVTLVKGISYSQAQKLSSQLWPNGDKESLFSRDGRFLLRLFVRSDAMATLVLAKQVLSAAFPMLKVSCIFLVVDDPECSWQFQSHDVSNTLPEQLAGHRICLDDFDLDCTHFNFADELKADTDAFSLLPTWGGPDPLQAAPVDRPTRCLMILEEMWRRQQTRADRLVASRPSDLAEAVSQDYGIEYPPDLWRHDMEDCLERGRFIDRLPDRDSCFGILPTGVARLLLLKRRFDDDKKPLTTGSIMQTLTLQARLWAAAAVA